MIDLKQIHLEGFRSFQLPTTFDLDRGGIVVIRGQNGVGKTTIFDALMWALYGMLTKDVSQDHVEPWESVRRSDHRGVRVSVEFEKEGRKYEVVRHYKYKGKTNGYKGGSSLLVFEDGKLRNEELQKKDSQAYLEGILGVSSKVFLRSILFGQRMSSLVKESDARKREILEEIFDTLYIPKAKEEAQKELRTLSDRISTKDAERDKAVLERDNLRASIEEAETLIKQFEERRDKEIEEFRDEIAKKEEHIEARSKEVKQKQGRISELSKELEGMEGVDSLKEKKDEARSNMDAIDSSIEERRKALKKERKEYEEKKEEVSELKKKEEKKQQQANDLEEEIEKTRKKVEELKEEKGNLDLSCGICGKDLSDHHKDRLNEYDRRIEKEEGAIEDLRTQLDTARKEEAEIKEKREEKETELEGLSEPSPVDEDKEIKRLKGRWEDVKKDLDLLKEEIERVENERAPKEKEKKELEEEVSNLKAEIEKDQNAIESREEDIEKKKNEKPPSVDIETKKERKGEEEKKIEELDATLEEARDRHKYISWWVEKGFSSSGLKAFIFQRMLERLNTRMRKYAEKLGALVRLKVDTTKKSKPFFTEVWMGDQQVFYEDLSGGQQQRVDIVLAFACHDIVADQGLINILAMDEIFEGLDDEGIESVFELVREKKGEGSIFIVTHLKEVTTTGAQELKILYNGETGSSEIV